MKKLLASVGLAVSLLFGSGAGVAQTSKPDIVEVIELVGEIHGGTAGYIKEQVDKINENPKVKAVLLVIQSPGGGAIATSNAYEELSKLKVPAVAWCNSICASGGYYIMMAPPVKHVAVRNDAISGSVGVIMTNTRFNRLLDYLKVDNETFKSGSLKDAGNPTRAAEKEEREYLQGIIDSLASGFYDVVAKGRSGKEVKWDEVKKAKVFIGKDGVKVGLADSVMTYEQAVEKAKSLNSANKGNTFTRYELKKIAKDAGGNEPSYQTPKQEPKNEYKDLMDLIKEVREGSSVKFEYRLPYRF